MGKKSSSSSKRESALQPQPPKSKRNARASLCGIFVAGALACVAVGSFGGTSLAIPVSTPPPTLRLERVTPEPSVNALQSTLPFDSSLIFVLDDPISSETTRTGSTVRAHLRDALIVNGVTVAPAGTPTTIRILHSARAQAGDYYGYVDIAFVPLHLPDGQDLPLRAPTAHLAAYDTVGHEDTVGVEEDVTNIILPIGMLYQAIRKGRNVTLHPGDMLRARTVGTVQVTDGIAVISTPAPIAALAEPPATSFHAMPFVDLPAQVPGDARQRHMHGSTPTLPPSPTPSAVATAMAGPNGALATPVPVSPFPQGREVNFVQQIQGDLLARFATAADAEKAGYFRYTNQDSTGAISYANLQWSSIDPTHPSQLWYDADGKLLGADFSLPDDQDPPSVWGVNPARWTRFRPHIHYVYVDATGVTIYGKATHVDAFEAAGGDPDVPTADTLVKMKLVPSLASVKHIFLFPPIWDLQVWIKPNPNGAFAETNPTVKT